MALVLYTEHIDPLDTRRARIDAGWAFFEQHRFVVPMPGKPEVLALSMRDEDGNAVLKLVSKAVWDGVGRNDLPRAPLHFFSLVDPDLTSSSAIPTWLSQLIDSPDALYLMVPRGMVETGSGEQLSRVEIITRHTGKVIQLRGMGGLVRLDDHHMGFELLARPELCNSVLLADPTLALIDAHASGSPRAPLFSGFSQGRFIHFADFHEVVSGCRWLMTTHGSEPVTISVYVSQARHDELLTLLAAHSPQQASASRSLPQRAAVELPPPYRVLQIEPEGAPLEQAEFLSIEARGRLDDLLACRSLRDLVVDGSLWLDDETIARLPQLRSLSMREVTVSDLDFLVPLVHLDDLRISRLPLAGVDELGKLSNLRALDISDAPVPSLAFTTKLERLETLRVDRLLDPDRALHDLAAHPNLHTVVIPEPDLANIDPLATLRLRHFESWNSKISDLTPLAGQRSLQKLSLQGTQVCDLGPLAGLQALRELWLLGCPVRDLGPLVGCSALRLLDLEYASEVDWNGLAPLAQLEVLYLQFSQIADLGPLSALSQLRVLNLRDTEVRSVEPLAKLQNLEELVIAGTAVRDLTHLARMPRLRRLIIDAEQAEGASRVFLAGVEVE